MILLVDSSKRVTAFNEGGVPILLYWFNGYWCDSNEDAVTPEINNSWILLHNSDTAIYQSMLTKSGDDFKKLPVIRFTGGDTTGKPESEAWVRYRHISGTTPFSSIELKALDNWVRNGSKTASRPWLLFEDKPNYSRGLLILLQLAQQIGPSNSSSSEWDVKTPQWWEAHLNLEDNWDELVKQELSRRNSPAAVDSLAEFIAWVNMYRYLPTPFDLFGDVEADEGRKQTRLAALIGILENVA